MGATGASRVGLIAASRTVAARRAAAGVLAGAVVSATAVLLFFGAGCAGPKGPAKRTVVFWQFSPLTAIQPILAKFEAENPTIHVEVEQLTWQSGREKIVAAIAAGRPPDLCELGSTFLPGLVADSTLVDLTDRIEDVRNTLLGWKVVGYQGRAYALPWMLGTRALYLNDDLFRRAGLDPKKPPVTWAEMYRAARLVSEKAPGAKGFGMNAGEREILFKKFMPFAWANGGDILDSSMTRSVFASRENLEALKFYLSLKPYSLLDKQEMHEEAFAKGRLGMIISGPWLLRKLPEQAPNLNFSVALMPCPAWDHGIPASFAGAEVLGIFRNAKHQEDAMQLARFLIRPENTMPLFLTTGNAFPAAWRSAGDPYFAEHPKDVVFLLQLKTAVGPPLHPRWVEIEEALNGELEEAIYGRKSPEAALKSADSEINAILARKP